MSIRKNFHLFLHLLCFTCFCFTGFAGNINPPPQIVRTNWVNPMSLGGCIILDEDSNLTFKMTFHTADPDLSNYPPVQMYYNFSWFAGSETGMTDVVTPAMLYPVTLANGMQVWEAEWTFVINFSTECEIVLGGNFELDKYIEMVTTGPGGGYQTYPYEFYIGDGQAFDAKVFIPNYDDQLPLSPPIWAAVKNLCCKHPGDSNLRSTSTTNPKESQEVDTEEHPLTIDNNYTIPRNTTLKSSSVKVYPNPFANEFTIEVNDEFSQDTTIELFDLQGKLIGTKTLDNHQSLNKIIWYNTQPLKKGIYFLRLSDKNLTETIKLVKN